MRHLPESQCFPRKVLRCTDLHAMNSSFAGVGICWNHVAWRNLGFDSEMKQNTESLRNQLFDLPQIIRGLHEDHLQWSIKQAQLIQEKFRRSHPASSRISGVFERLIA